VSVQVSVEDLTSLTNSWGLCWSTSSENGRPAHRPQKPHGGCVAPIQVSVDDLLTSLTSSRALYGPTSGECGWPVYHTRQPHGGYVAHIQVSVDNFPNVFGSLMDIMMILFIYMIYPQRLRQPHGVTYIIKIAFRWVWWPSHLASLTTSWGLWGSSSSEC